MSQGSGNELIPLTPDHTRPHHYRSPTLLTQSNQLVQKNSARVIRLSQPVHHPSSRLQARGRLSIGTVNECRRSDVSGQQSSRDTGSFAVRRLEVAQNIYLSISHITKRHIPNEELLSYLVSQLVSTTNLYRQKIDIKMSG